MTTRGDIGRETYTLLSNWKTRLDAANASKKHKQRGPVSIENRVKSGHTLHPREFIRAVLPFNVVRDCVQVGLAWVGPNTLTTNGWPDTDQVGDDPRRKPMTELQLRLLRRSLFRETLPALVTAATLALARDEANSPFETKSIRSVTTRRVGGGQLPVRPSFFTMSPRVRCLTRWPMVASSTKFQSTSWQIQWRRRYENS